MAKSFRYLGKNVIKTTYMNATISIVDHSV